MDTLFLPFLQKTDCFVIDEIKHIAPARPTLAGGRAAFENGSVGARVI